MAQKIPEFLSIVSGSEFKVRKFPLKIDENDVQFCYYLCKIILTFLVLLTWATHIKAAPKPTKADAP